MPSANRPTASGLSRSRPPRDRAAGPAAAGRRAGRARQPRRARVAPVLGQQVVEDVVDATAPTSRSLRVDHRRRHQVVGGEVAGHLGQRRLRAQRFEVVEHAADQRRTVARAAAAGCARAPGSGRSGSPTAAGRRRPGWPATAGSSGSRTRASASAIVASGRGSPARWSSCRRRCPRSSSEQLAHRLGLVGLHQLEQPVAVDVGQLGEQVGGVVGVHRLQDVGGPVGLQRAPG